MLTFDKFIVGMCSHNIFTLLNIYQPEKLRYIPAILEVVSLLATLTNLIIRLIHEPHPGGVAASSVQICSRKLIGARSLGTSMQLQLFRV